MNLDNDSRHLSRRATPTVFAWPAPGLPPPESLAAPNILPDTPFTIDETLDEPADQFMPGSPGSERVYLLAILK